MNTSAKNLAKISSGEILSFVVSAKDAMKLIATFNYKLGDGTKHPNSHYSAYIIDKGARSGTHQHIRLMVLNDLQPSEQYLVKVRLVEPIPGVVTKGVNGVVNQSYIGLYMSDTSKPADCVLAVKNTKSSRTDERLILENETVELHLTVTYSSNSGACSNTTHLVFGQMLVVKKI